MKKLAGAAAIMAAIIAAVAWQAYSVEQTRQAGLEFGAQLSQIQDDLQSLQFEFADIASDWDGGSAELAEAHLADMESLVSRYSDLRPPPGFEPSVELFRMSAQSQLESDREYVEWLRRGDEASLARSDALLQDAFELETAALGKFDRAKKGLP